MKSIWGDLEEKEEEPEEEVMFCSCCEKKTTHKIYPNYVPWGDDWIREPGGTFYVCQVCYEEN